MGLDSILSTHAGHLTTETVFRQTLVLWLANGDEYCALESDTTGHVKENLYLYLEAEGLRWMNRN